MKSNVRLLRPIALAVGSCFGMSAWANPIGPQVMSGSATFQGLGTSSLQVRNTPGTIINWQGFSIGQGQLTQFLQQSPTSAVLNRVVGADISQINGSLLSNGRVFLINPAGIVIGASGVIDTAGFVGSTLNMLDADFLAGRLKFQGDASSGGIVNQGTIRTGYGGSVVLVAPNIENGKDALIQTPGGELILAAGQKVTIGSLDPNGVQFEVQAPADSVVNLGQLIAQGGAVGVFAGTLRHSGDIRADALVRDDAGRIVLKAQGDVTLASGSVTSASGRRGGDIMVLGDNVTVSGRDANAGLAGARIDASGTLGGGTIRIGGDYRGANQDLQNAATTSVGAGATLHANAGDTGDGGRIIVWSDRSTRFEGDLAARGGRDSGNGGFAEVSGKEQLFFDGGADLGSGNGALGTLLLDPLDLYVKSGGGQFSDILGSTAFPSNAATVEPATLAKINGNVSLFASRYMLIDGAINLTTAGQTFTAEVGTFTPGSPAGTPPNQLDIAQNISTTGGAVTLTAPFIQTLRPATIATSGGAVTLNSSGDTRNIQTSQLSVDAGAGAVTAAGKASVQFSNIAGGTLTLNVPGSISTGTIGTAGAVSLSGSSIFTGAITSGGGAVTAASPGFISLGGVNAGSGNVTLTSSGSSINVFGNPIDTTGAVALSATSGTISAKVNNAASVNASSTTSASFQSANISLSSDTALNAISLNSAASGCSVAVTNSCAGAFVTVNAAGNINVGNITASAAVSNTGSKSATVSLTSTGGSILSAGSTTVVRATDVSLATGQGSGGGIGVAGSALNVDVERSFAFAPNGNFNVLLNGTGPNILSLAPGVAATGQTYSGSLTRSGGGIAFTANATDTTVTVPAFTVSGFNQAVFNSPPSISLFVPNGALIANNIVVPQGDTTVPPPLSGITTQPLPVSIGANGDLRVDAYTRQSTAASLAKVTSFFSSLGKVVLGAIDGSKDSVSVSGASDVSITRLTTGGAVSASSTSGNVILGQVDTTSGTGGVTLSAADTPSIGGKIAPMSDSVAVDILSGGSVSLSARTIGESTFANPLDIAAPSVTLSSASGIGGSIGFAGRPVVANTPTLTINATNAFAPAGAQFNVTTGSTALRDLTVLAHPAVGSGGVTQVRTEAGQPNDRTYNFASDGTRFTFAAGNVPSTQFNNGTLSFTSAGGDIALGDSNLGANGSLAVSALNGSITGAAALDGKSLVLSAGTGNQTSAVTLTTGNIGSANTAQISLTAGRGSGFSALARQGSVQTGNVNSAGTGTIDIATFGGNIEIGAGGTLDIGSGAARAGAVTFTSSNGPSATSGDLKVRDMFAKSISTTSLEGNTTTRNLDATDTIAMLTHRNVNTGTLDADRITIANEFFLNKEPTMVLGTIGAVRAPTTLELTGEASTAGGTAVNLLGPVTLAPASTMSVTIFRSGATKLGGPIVAGAGSNIAIGQFGPGPLQFSTINAGAGGTVSLGSNPGIQQTVSAATGGGITADNVSLFSTTGAINNSADPSGRVDLFGVKSLTVTSGAPVALDAHGSTLNSINVTRNATVAAAPFELANLGSGQVVTMASAPTDMTLVARSPSTPLAVTITNNAGALTLGSAMATSGGAATLNASGALDTSAGITTAGGAVALRSVNSNVTTGVIDTTAAAPASGGSVTVTSNGTLALNGNVNAGTGSFVSLGSVGDVSRGGTARITADTVTVSASNGNIGGAAPLLISSPDVTLSAGGAAAGGFAFATLTGTTRLALTATNGFNVASDAPFDTLSVSTRGSGMGAPGSGTLNLAAGGGQVYAFARPSTDAFGAGINNTFQLISGGGAAAPSQATFNALDGTLLVVGGASLASPTLTLGIPFGSSSDIVLQGTAASPLTLSNTTQNFAAPRDLVITGNVTLNATTQNLSAARDITATGRIALTGSDQNFTAQRNFTAQAAGGSLTITGGKQKIGATTGAVSFIGGDNADETLTVTASQTQRLYTPFNQGTDVVIRGGRGDRASVLVSFTGTDGPADPEGNFTTFNGVTEGQLLQARGTVSVQGGAGANSTALVTTGTASQLVRAGDRGVSDPAVGNIRVLGGAGSGANARITNTGTGNQQIGESRQSCGTSCIDFFFQTRDIEVKGGAGNGALAQITTTGPQQIYSRGGTLFVTGGDGVGSNAKIESTNASEQRIGLPTYLSGVVGNPLASAIVQGGTASGNGSTATIVSPDLQRITTSGLFAVRGGAIGSSAAATGATQEIRIGGADVRGGAGDNASALVQSAGAQNVRALSFSNAMTVAGGAGAGASARVNAGLAQTVSYTSLAVNGGAGAGAFARVDTPGVQTLSGGSLSLSVQGTTAAPVANAGALVEGQSQTISGSVSVTGGVGVTGAASDALVHNIFGRQSLNTFGVTMVGGTRESRAAIINDGGDTQSVTGTLSLTSPAGAEASAPVLIQNTGATTQSLCTVFGTTCSTTGSVSLASNGNALVAITSGGNQVLNVQSLNVATGTGSTGNAMVSATGTQWVHTSNFSTTTPSMRVAALGTGKASVESASTQLLEVDYPDVMAPGATRRADLIIGDSNAIGTSLVQGVDQSVFAGSISILAASSAQSKLVATGAQAISLLPGGTAGSGITLTTSGGGSAATAAIDPTSQSILSNGPVNLSAGGGPVSLFSTGPQTLVVTNGPLNLFGSSAASNSTINTTAPGSQQVILASGGITLTGFATIGAGPEPGSVGADVTGAAGANSVLRTQEELDAALSRSAIEREEDAAAGRKGRIQLCQ